MRLLWILAVSILIAACDRSPAPAAGKTAPAASPAPVTQDPLSPYLGTLIDGTDPDFPTQFKPVRLPDELKQLTEPTSHPTREQMIRAGALLERLRLQKAEVARYLAMLANPPSRVTSDAVEAVLMSLWDLELSEHTLYGVVDRVFSLKDSDSERRKLIALLSVHPSSFDSLELTGASDTVRQALRRVGRRMAAAIGPCTSQKARTTAYLLGSEDRNTALHVPLDLRFEFAQARYEAGESSCRTFQDFDLARVDDEQRARLAALIGDESRSRATAEMAMLFHEACRSGKSDPAVAAIGICPWARGAIGGVPTISHEPQLHPDRRSAFEHVKTPTEYWINSDRTIVVFPDYPGKEVETQAIHVAIIKRAGNSTPAPIAAFGQYLDDRVIAVTDEDHDGNVEIWIHASNIECDGDAEDGVHQKPGVTCAVGSDHRLEQFGGDLIPYIEGSRPPTVPAR